MTRPPKKRPPRLDGSRRESSSNGDEPMSPAASIARFTEGVIDCSVESDTVNAIVNTVIILYLAFGLAVPVLLLPGLLCAFFSALTGG